MQRPDPMGRPLRFGVCGSGHWAKIVHLPTLVTMPAVECVGVWGKTQEQSKALADQFAIRAFADFDALLNEVDVVSFAVPPGVQATMALRAANAGKHLLLEKPVATTIADADRLMELVERQQLSTVTFLTRLFVDGANDLVARARAGKHNRGEVSWSSRALLPGTPYTNSAWRNADFGTLWDLGPHVLSVLVPVLGPVAQIKARRVRKAKFECRIFHAGGAESFVTLDQMDESLAQGSHEHYVFSGGDGVARGGPFTYKPVHCFEAAVGLLIDDIKLAGRLSGSNIRFSRDIVAALESACLSIESNGASVDVRR